MDFFSNLLVSITIVAIFSSIILNIINEGNSQREIVKISCGLLMIVVLLEGINNGFSADLSAYEDFYAQYENLSLDAQTTYEGLENDIVRSELQDLILEKTGVTSTVYFSKDYVISRITVDNDTKNYEISQLLGISENLIEYIESR